MTEMTPESPTPIPIEVRAEVEVVSYIEVVVDGPGGLKATLHVPDDDTAYDELDTFVGALPQAIEAAMRAAEERANG